MHRLIHLWRSIKQLVRGPEPPEPACYDARDDPVVRWLRKEELDSARRSRHNTPIRRDDRDFGQTMRVDPFWRDGGSDGT